MNPGKSPRPGGANEEVPALIETLHKTERRLEELTAGEVDTVAERDGRTLLLRRAQDHLRHNEAAKQAAILNALPAHIALLDTQGRIISVNEAWRRFASANAMQGPRYTVGLSYLEICDSARGDDATEAHLVAAGIRSVLGGGVNSFSLEYPCHSPTEQRWFLLTVTPLADDHPNGVVVMHLNITERKIADVKIRRQRQLFAALSQCNQAIARCASEEELFPQICRTAVQLGGMKMAWIGIADTETLMVRPAASFGDDAEYLGDIEISADADSPFGRGPAGTAIREKQPFWCQDFQNDPVTVPWRERARHAGFAASASLPLHREGIVVGAFTLYSGEANSFDEAARDLLVEMATDISFALNNFARESQRKEAEARIVHFNRVYAMLSGINTLIVRVRGRGELFREACRIAVEEGGFRMSMIAIVDRSAMKIVPVASEGVDDELLAAVNVHLSSSGGAPKGETTFARVIREKKAVVSDVSPDNPTVMFGKQSAGSTVVLPLIVSDEAVGILALYASESEFFQEEEMKLLTQLAGDIAFAIDHIEKQERLDYLAYYDVLTGLANRSLFLDRVAQYMRSAASGGHKLVLFLIDLERFKNINDSLGRPAGDALLRQVAEWLTRNAGDANLLARVGADHFAALLPEVKQEGGVARLLEKTMEAFLAHPFHLHDAVFRIAAKVGIALFPDDGANADTLFRNAEAALKKAKASGDRYLFYTQRMTATVAGRLTLENHLRQALDKGEFVLHYQPKVNLASGQLTSAEALIRWKDPRTGLVPPGRFIPILEETGLIYEVGRWALRQAIADYLRWRAAGLAAVRIAVNVSPLQLRHRGFIAEIRQAIGIDAQAAAGLELELTESLIMEDVKHSIASLRAIRAMGVTIAIDDFGIGFSSLSYLSKLPVDTLKIDRSFVVGMTAGPADTMKIDRSFVVHMTAGPEGLALVSTIINLAHALKLKVVAEGVETEEQARLLRLLNCDEMQGFLFSKPVPSEIFETRFLSAP